MQTLSQLQKALCEASAHQTLAAIYGTSDSATSRYARLLTRFAAQFPHCGEAMFFSTPGRTEIGGNHTDHNCGHILAAAVTLDIVALVAKQEGVIHICSDGYPEIEISLTDLAPRPQELGSSAALVRGVFSRFVQLGYCVGGFCSVMTSQVLGGSGLSSSAAFEVQIGNILNHLYNDGCISPIQLAQIAQYAENVYFGKPCGLMDMMTCAIGGMVMIDFKNLEAPEVLPVSYDFQHSGYQMILLDTGGSHADMTDEYSALEHEMKATARALGGQTLRDVSKATLFEKLHWLRTQVSDRAILRAIHFFDDDLRVLQQAHCLEKGDFQEFLKLVVESGHSSWELCQNCYSSLHTQTQGISIALELSREILAGQGSYRVHGGGFAGTIQAFVPNACCAHFCASMRTVFGADAIFPTTIRPQGAISINF